MASEGNASLVCHDPYKITARGILWDDGDPLLYSLPLFLLQVSLISIIYRILFICLKPLGQPTVVCQILSGVVLGPSMIGHDKVAGSTLFPARGTMLLETAATFGITFFLFGVGVKMDPEMMFQPGKKAIVIGISLFFFTLTIPMAFTSLLTETLTIDKTLAASLPYITGSQSLTSFPVIACLLTELKILNTEIGRLAVSSAMFCDFIGIALTAFAFSILENREAPATTAILAIGSTLLFVLCIVYAVRPIAFWVQNNTEFGKTANDSYMCVVFVVVMVSTFLSELVGQHYSFGPFLLGFVMPDGPPMGAAVAMKLELLVDGILYPVYSAIGGLNTDTFQVGLEATWIVGCIVLLSSVVKIGAVMGPAMNYKMEARDAFVLGLILNAKGIIELIVYGLWRRNKILKEESYSLAILSVVIVTGIVTPLIQYIYDPSRQYVSLRRSTIQSTTPDSEFRVMVCVHKQETTPPMINLLEISNPNPRSPMAVTALALVELVGRATPILVAHRPSDPVSGPTTASSGRIITAFQSFQAHHDRTVRLQPFTSVSHFKTIHDDICQLAVSQRAHVVIVPFHKEWAIDGTVGFVNTPIRHINLNVLEKAPCSVGILIDRSTSAADSSRSVLRRETSFRVGVIFIGGADDVEALAYGSRMAGHPFADVTVVRFLLFGSENSKERRRDSELIDMYRRQNAGNGRFKCAEKLARDGVGFGEAIRELEDRFELIVAGKHHEESPLISGLDQWSECKELGVVGDMLASPDLLTKVSVLVVQQQRTGGNYMKRAMKAAAHSGRERDREEVMRELETSHRSGPVAVSAAHHHPESWTVPINN